jgi:RNA polymerase sigma-70 factor (ECF subfamily)
MHRDDEALLVRRAKQGDEAAFGEIYTRHHDAVYAYLYYRVNDVQVAEDLAGEVFVRLVAKMNKFTYRGRPILAWLYTIARNLLIDHRRRQAQSGTLALEEGWETPDPGPPEVTQRGLTRDCLLRALQRLTEDQQRVLLHKLIEGRSNAEVAGLLGKTEGAIKSLQHRALDSLRRAVKEERCYEPQV